MALAALMARVILRPVRPGRHPRGGKAHLRLWLAQRIQDELAATSLAGALWFPTYARLLGADIGKGVDLHTLPPVTGLLRIGKDASIEPEVDLGGFWIDGDAVHIGSIHIGARARIGVRSMLAPGARVGRDAEVAPGSFVRGTVPDGQYWAGSPAERRARTARGPWSTGTPPAESAWLVAYALTAVLIASLPGVSALVAASILVPTLRDATSLGDAVQRGLPWLPLADRGRVRRAGRFGSRVGAVLGDGRRGRPPPGAIVARPPHVGDASAPSTRPAPGSSRSTPAP